MGTASIADDARPAYLEVTETDRGHFDVHWKRPEVGGRAAALTPLFPEHCKQATSHTERSRANIRVQEFSIDCQGKGLAGYDIGIGGLTASTRDVIVRVALADRTVSKVLRAGRPAFEIQPSLSPLQVASDYLSFGIKHILVGFDHLLFVFALLFLIPGLLGLIKAVTAFTLAHSLTLGAAVLGWISVPLPPVEACIALSVLFLATEIVRKLDGKTSLTLQWPWIAALGFGLIHGFGFASALQSVGLPPSDIPLALLFFNLGVEVGQLLFVIPAFAVIRVISRYGWSRAIERAGAYGIGTISAFWVIDRVLLF